MSTNNDMLTNSDNQADKSGLDAERTLLRLSDLVPDPHQPRLTPTRDENYDGLVQSIKEDGLINDLLVRSVECSDVEAPNGEDYYIIAGTRRYHAVREAERPGLMIPCKVVKVDDEEAASMAINDNVHRKDLTDYELIRAIANRYEQLAEHLVPEDEPVDCPECGKECNGRKGLQRHISMSSGHENKERENFSRSFVSKHDICKKIAEIHFGPDEAEKKARTVENVVRVSRLPGMSIALAKTKDEQDPREKSGLEDRDVEELPHGSGEGVSTELVKLASLNESSEIESDAERGSYLIRAYASDVSIPKIRSRVVDWQEVEDDPITAFKNALNGKQVPKETEEESEEDTEGSEDETVDTPDKSVEESDDEESEESEPVSDVEDEDTAGSEPEPEDDGSGDEPEPEPEVEPEPDSERTETEPEDGVDDSKENVEEETEDGSGGFEEDSEPETEDTDEAEEGMDTDASSTGIDVSAVELVELSGTQRAVVKQMPATNKEISEALETPTSSISSRVAEIRDAHGEAIITTEDQTYHWNGPILPPVSADEIEDLEYTTLQSIAKDIDTSARGKKTELAKAIEDVLFGEHEVRVTVRAGEIVDKEGYLPEGAVTQALSDGIFKDKDRDMIIEQLHEGVSNGD